MNSACILPLKITKGGIKTPLSLGHATAVIFATLSMPVDLTSGSYGCVENKLQFWRQILICGKIIVHCLPIRSL
jgi:hypothetical protein